VGGIALSPGLVVVDFDGTVTERDTLDQLCSRHAPGVYRQVEGDLREGRISLRECIRLEFEPIRGDHEAIVREAVASATVRAGFAGFVRSAEAAGHRVVVVSSGFECVIRPVLEREGVGDLELIAHDVRFSPEGTTVEFRHGSPCPECGEECKRSVLAELHPERPVAYVGDGYSDRCASKLAGLRFAREGLARYLRGHGIDFVPFEDFDVIREALC
jgi:2-hydroxy-3-keto-5-methylthiopentenyl-1-phosphate phosphatase